MRHLPLRLTLSLLSGIAASPSAHAAPGGGVSVQLVDSPDGSSESWEEVEARFHCRKDEPRPDCIERIRGELRKELAAPTLALAGYDKCSGTPRDPCELVFDGCTTRAEVYLSALAKLGTDAAPAAPEILQALRSRPSLEESALRALVAIHSAEALNVLDKRLDSPEVQCRWSAFRGAQALGPVARKLLPHLQRVAWEGDWHDRQDAVQALAAVDGPASVGTLRKVLERPPLSAQVAALKELMELGPAAKDAAPELLWTAQHHWSPDVRCRAAKTSKAVAGTIVPPAGCAGSRATFKGSAVVLPDGERVPLETLSRASFQGKATGPCTGADTGKASFVMAKGDACLVGIDMGEWGGELVEYRGGKKRSLRQTWYLNPRRAVEAHGRLFVLEGMNHMGPSPGAVTELVPGSDGWRAVPFLDAGAPLRAVGLSASGDLLLAGDRHVPFESTACAETATCGSASSFLLRIDARGEVLWVP